MRGRGDAKEKRGPESIPNRSAKAFQHRSRKSECPGQSQTLIEKLCGPLGAWTGLTLGPTGGHLWQLKMIKMRHIEWLEKDICRIQVGSALGGSQKEPCWGQVGL